MRAVLGILFLVVGFVVAYQVLTGKFPSFPPITPPPPTAGSDITGSQINNRYRNQNQTITGTGTGHTVTGLPLPTMANLNDLIASNGGMA